MIQFDICGTIKYLMERVKMPGRVSAVSLMAGSPKLVLDGLGQICTRK